jgi:hypothetical protein
MKRFLKPFVMIGLGLFMTVFVAQAQKQKYSSEQGKMSIVFPAAYETSEISTSEDMQTLKTTSQLGDMTYFASYTLHSIPMENPEDLAKESLDAFVAQLNGVLMEQEIWKVKKHNGQLAHITLQIEDANARIEYRVIIIGQLQYQIIAMTDADTWDSKTVKKFMKSFKVKK